MRIRVKKFSLMLEAAPEKPLSFAVMCDGAFRVENPAVPGTALFTVNGITSISRVGNAVEVKLQASGAGRKFLAIGPIPLFTVPVAGQPSVEPKFEASLESFVFRLAGSQWTASAGGSSRLTGLPAPMDRMLPSELAVSATIGSAGARFSLTLDKPFAFKVPPLDFGRGPVEFGTAAVLISGITVDLGKLSIAGEFGIGIPSELNRRAGAEIFRLRSGARA
jgi:hypothetical protein